MFIAFEGLDGSGSSTHAKILFDRLQNLKHKVSLTKEPTNNIIGGLIRGALTHQWDIDSKTFQLLFAADRGHHLTMQIKPWLKDDRIVITDRYKLSSLAYGSIEMSDMQWLENINSKFQKPDITILLKVSPEECMRRIVETRSSKEYFEKVEVLKKVWNNYEVLAKQYNNIYIVDGQKPKEEVHEEIWNIIGKKI